MLRYVKVVHKISNSKNLNRISTPAFLTPPSLALSRYRSWSFNLKTAFHAFKLHAKVASSIPFLPFIPRFPPALLSPDFFSGSSPIPGIFSRGSSIRLHSSHRKRGSFESLLSFLVFHGLMLPDQRFVGGIRIYLGTSRDASGLAGRYITKKEDEGNNNERKINAPGGKSPRPENI